VVSKSNIVTATPTNAKATVEFAKVASGKSLNEEDFWEDSSFEFATGDSLAIKVTAEDKKTH